MSDRNEPGNAARERRLNILNVVLTVAGLAVVIVPFILCVLPSLLPKARPGPTETPTAGPPPTPTATSTRAPTATPIPTATPVATPANLPAQAVLGDTWARPNDGMEMVYVPAGTFQMGTPADAPIVHSDEVPPHPVSLSGFWIDQTEVSNAQYASCVATGACLEPYRPALEQFKDYYSDSQYADYPVIYVSWLEAATYCGWAGGQLPSEAQWEYAARGPDSFIYPWGNTPPDDTLLNYDHNVDFPTRVGSYPKGASWCGGLDMAGNNWEWVADWFGHYTTTLQVDPIGPPQGYAHVLHGGSWYDDADFCRSANRYALSEPRRDYYAPTGYGFNVGFRCVVVP